MARGIRFVSYTLHVSRVKKSTAVGGGGCESLAWPWVFLFAQRATRPDASGHCPGANDENKAETRLTEKKYELLTSMSIDTRTKESKS